MLDKTLTFGKYKGQTWGQVLGADPGYVRWAIDNVERLEPEDVDELAAWLEREGR